MPTVHRKNWICEQVIYLALLLAALATPNNVIAQDFSYLAEFEMHLKRIDDLYKAGKYQQSLRLSDSIEPAIVARYGDTNFLYGYFIVQNPSMIYEQLKNFSMAEKEYKRGMHIMKTAGNEIKYEYAEASINIGNLYGENGLHYQAKTFAIQGRMIMQLLHMEDAVAFAAGTNNLANSYNQSGEYLLAEQMYDTALQLIDKLLPTHPELKPERLKIFNNLATLYNQMGDYEKGRYYLERVFENLGASTDKKSLYYNTMLNNMGNLQLAQDSTTSAISYFVSATNNLGTIQPRNRLLKLSIVNAIVETLIRQKKIDSALHYCEKNLLLFSDNPKETMIAYWYLLNNYGRALMAANQLQKSQQVLDSLHKATSTNNQFQDAWLAAGILHNRALINLLNRNYNASRLIADSLWQLNQQTFNHNFFTLPETGKMALAANLTRAMQLYTAAWYGAGMKDSSTTTVIFQRQSMLRGLLLEKESDAMEQIKNTSNSASRRTYDEWKSNRNFLGLQYKLPPAKRSKITDSIAFANEKIEQELKRLHPFIDTTADHSQPSAAGISQQLAKGACLLQFMRFAAGALTTQKMSWHYGVFLIKKGSVDPVWVYLGTETKLLRILQSSGSQAIDDNNIGQLLIDPRLKENGRTYPADQLYSYLLKPLLRYLKGVHQINCISDGLLTQIPLEAIDASVGTRRSNNYHYYLSVHSFINSSQPATKKQSISIWGGINYSASDSTLPGIATKQRNGKDEAGHYSMLPFSEQEANSIARILQPAYAIYKYTAGKASETNFKKFYSAAGTGIIHVSTHGYCNSAHLLNAGSDVFARAASADFVRMRNPLLECGLVMAGANRLAKQTDYIHQNDGLLTGYEIASMNFSGTDLVVLSACETGLGKITASEGVYGLQRAFKLAGAKKIVMSLWKISDKVSAMLMQSFYQHVAAGQNYQDALSAAKQAIRLQFPSPYFWAGFVLVE